MSSRQEFHIRRSIAEELRRLTNGIMIPMALFSVLLLGLLLFFSVRFTNVTRNITLASGFNQNFKSEVDLKMYCYAAGSSEELPTAQIAEARQLAQQLQFSTGSRDGRRSIGIVLDLYDKLEVCIEKICQTDNYDDRMAQLENNIYIITELVQNHMYNYLYYEAGNMAQMQGQQVRLMAAAVILSILVMAAIIVVTSVRSVRTARNITQPVDALYQRVCDIGRGELTPGQPIAADDEKLQALSTGIEKMVLDINTQMALNVQRQVRLRDMEMQLLQAQINPHFLYNTLDAIIWLIEAEKNREAQEMVRSLSTYFRSFLSEGRDVITISEEVKHVRSYLEIQHVRYRDILSYSIDTDPRFDACAIPKMTLQPLVENAIYHGIKLRRGGGEIFVTVRGSGADVYLEVRDTGIGMDPGTLQTLLDSMEEGGSGFGLHASYRRLKLRYGEHCHFTITSEKNVGTVIGITIPVQAEGEEKHG